MYKFDCFIFRRPRKWHAAQKKRRRRKKLEMEIRYTSIPEKKNKQKQKQKTVYNIIKVIPDSFYCLHYASILLAYNRTYTLYIHPTPTDRPCHIYCARSVILYMYTKSNCWSFFSFLFYTARRPRVVAVL